MPLINRTGGGGSNIKFIASNNGQYSVPAVKSDVPVPEITATESDVWKDKVAFTSHGFTSGTLEPLVINFYHYDHTWLGAISVKAGDCSEDVNAFTSKLKDPNAVDHYSRNAAFPLTNLGGYKFGGWIPFTDDAIVVPDVNPNDPATEFPADYFLPFDNVTENMNVIAAFHECAETLGGGSAAPLGRTTRYDIVIGSPDTPVIPYRIITLPVIISKKEFGRYYDPNRMGLIIYERSASRGEARRVYPDYFKGRKEPLAYEFKERGIDVINRIHSNGFSICATSQNGSTITTTVDAGAKEFFTPFVSIDIKDSSGNSVSSFAFPDNMEPAIFYITGSGSNENEYHEFSLLNPNTSVLSADLSKHSNGYKLTVQKPSLSAGESILLTLKDRYHPDSGISKTLEITVSE